MLGIDRQELVEPGRGGLELATGVELVGQGQERLDVLRVGLELAPSGSATLASSTAGAPLVASATWLAAGAPFDGAGFTIALAPRATAAMAMTAAPPSTIRFQTLGPAGAVAATTGCAARGVAAGFGCFASGFMSSCALGVTIA